MIVDPDLHVRLDDGPSAADEESSVKRSEPGAAETGRSRRRQGFQREAEHLELGPRRAGLAVKPAGMRPDRVVHRVEEVLVVEGVHPDQLIGCSELINLG